jgi:hypothetical protein
MLLSYAFRFCQPGHEFTCMKGNWEFQLRFAFVLLVYEV